MGIPRFYRWLSERYPLINENITAEQIPEFDNLYLDMNGIVHNCSHNNTGGLCVNEENDVFVEAFKYITRLFNIIRPKKLLYMAVDGCAPRAKMNQQRSRRFRAANDAREAREQAEEMGEEIPGTPFDSNCITPGTEFMWRLTEHLRFFVCKQVQENPAWQDVVIILSGPDVPGEGEHKIMDYIRTSKAQPDYDPNMRHCLYGLDADLIMLALASHEPHFALLREEVVFGRRSTESVEQRKLIAKDRFQLLHISLLREYLALEFAPQKEQAFAFNLERFIDDLILFSVLVGNDFLPCLPFAEIGEGGLEDFITAYKEHLEAARSSRPPWLTQGCGEVAFPQLAVFLERYARVESDRLQCAVNDETWVLGKRRLVGPKDAPEPSEGARDPPEAAPTVEDARVQYYSVKFGMDLNTYQGTQEQRSLFKSYLEGLQWVLRYYYKGSYGASWSWYYPFYHAPLVADLVTYDELAQPEIRFDVGEPFRPFQQLMAVLPASSKAFLPQCYQWLFDSPESPILHFYPQRFEVDVDGVKVPWGGVTLIPFIDPSALLAAMLESERRGPPLTEDEQRRNEVGKARCLRYDHDHSKYVCSTMPTRFKSLEKCPVRLSDFHHQPLPPGMANFPNYLLPGCKQHAPGFPSLALHPVTTTFEMGVKVFQNEARGKSHILHLHPAGPMIPGDRAIKQLLEAPSVQIDFPMVHYGKVVAVHTPRTRFLQGGKMVDNNPRDHENTVRQLLQDWRRRGLTVDFEGSSFAGDAAAGRGHRGHNVGSGEDELLQQPIVEVRVADASFFDGDGRLQHRLRSMTEYRLLHLVNTAPACPALGRPHPLSERFPRGASVLCIARGSDVFGQMGTIERSSNDAGSLEARFNLGFTREETEALQRDIQALIAREKNSVKWYELSDVAKRSQLDIHVTRQILGSLMARCADHIREDIGMNLIHESRSTGDVLCLPGYSFKSKDGWRFSDLAIEALRDYQCKFPGVFEALRNRHDTYWDLEASSVFPDCRDTDYAAKQLVKYCNGCPFKKLRLVPGQHSIIPTHGIAEVMEAVDLAYSGLDLRTPRSEVICGHDAMFRAEDIGSRLPAELFKSKDVFLGQRGLYGRAKGPVPFGAKGTVTGIYGTGAAQELELLLDVDSFGATNLHGRTPAMRGVLLPANAFVPLANDSSIAQPASASSQSNAAGVSNSHLLPPTSERMNTLPAVAQAPASQSRNATNLIKGRLHASLGSTAGSGADSTPSQDAAAEAMGPVRLPPDSQAQASSKHQLAAGCAQKAQSGQKGSKHDADASAISKERRWGNTARSAEHAESGAGARRPQHQAFGWRREPQDPLFADWDKAFNELLSLGRPGDSSRNRR